MLNVIFIGLTILFAITTIIFFIKEIYFLKKNKEKITLNTIKALFSMLASVCSYMNVNIEKPEIYPSNNETEVYHDSVQIEIKTDWLSSVYYTLDGEDPKKGNKYIEPFKLTSSTTVSAKRKFLIWWSDISKEPYKFEEDSDNKNSSLQITNTEINSDEKFTENKSSEDKTEVDTYISQTTEETTTLELNSVEIYEGQNPSKGMALLDYLNQYRVEIGVNELTWNSDLERVAQDFAKAATTYSPVTSVGEFCIIIRQCNGIINAQEIVSDWITGNDYIQSESKKILNSAYEQMGGALYYLPDGNENGYHYFWVICMK